MKYKTKPLAKNSRSLLVIASLALAADPALATTIYQDNFNGSTTNNSLNGAAPDTRPASETWVSSEWRASGTVATLNATSNDDGAYLPFVPTTGFIYTLSMTAAQPSFAASTAGWLGLGFTAGNTASDTSFATATIGAAPWLLWRPSTAANPNQSQVVTRLGPGTSLDGSGDNQNEGPFTGTQTLTIVLNTVGAAWTAEWFVGAISVRSSTYATNPTINYVGFARENGQTSTITNFELTSVPEPSAALLGGLGLLALLRRRRGN